MTRAAGRAIDQLPGRIAEDALARPLLSVSPGGGAGGGAGAGALGSRMRWRSRALGALRGRIVRAGAPARCKLLLSTFNFLAYNMFAAAIFM